MSLPVHGLAARDPIAVASLYLVEHRGVLSLVDTGTRGTTRRVLRALERLGRRPEDVRQIVITHGHGDHAGAAKALREVTGARVVVGAQDAGLVRGEVPYRTATGLLRPIYRHLANFPRFDPDVLISERTELDGGLVAIPAPGHTPGHLAILAPDVQALFTGDTVWRLGPVHRVWRQFTADPERNLESVRELSAEPAEQLFFGHGPAVRRGGRDRLHKLAGRRD